MEHVYNKIGEKDYPLEENLMHTCGRIRPDRPQTPLGGLMSSETTSNGHEWSCKHV